VLEEFVDLEVWGVLVRFFVLCYGFLKIFSFMLSELVALS